MHVRCRRFEWAAAHVPALLKGHAGNAARRESTVRPRHHAVVARRRATRGLLSPSRYTARWTAVGRVMSACLGLG